MRDREAAIFVDAGFDPGVECSDRAIGCSEPPSKLDFELSHVMPDGCNAGKNVTRQQAYRELVRVLEDGRFVDFQTSRRGSRHGGTHRTEGICRLHPRWAFRRVAEGKGYPRRTREHGHRCTVCRRFFRVAGRFAYSWRAPPPRRVGACGLLVLPRVTAPIRTRLATAKRLSAALPKGWLAARGTVTLRQRPLERRKASA